jgi:hypothetical protein
MVSKINCDLEIYVSENLCLASFGEFVSSNPEIHSSTSFTELSTPEKIFSKIISTNLILYNSTQ